MSARRGLPRLGGVFRSRERGRSRMYSLTTNCNEIFCQIILHVRQSCSACYIDLSIAATSACVSGSMSPPKSATISVIT